MHGGQCSSGVAADGLGGGAIKKVLAHVSPVANRRGANVESFPAFYEPAVIHMAYGSEGYAGLEDGTLNIAAALDVGAVDQLQNPGAVIARTLDQTHWPAIPDLSDASWHGTPPLTRQLARPAGPRALAIGDSSGYVETFTREGIGWALSSGVKVAEFAGASLRRWQPHLAEEWIRLQAKTRDDTGRLCRTIAWVSRRPRLARQLVGCVGRWPWLANPLLRRIASA